MTEIMVRTVCYSPRVRSESFYRNFGHCCSTEISTVLTNVGGGDAPYDTVEWSNPILRVRAFLLCLAMRKSRAEWKGREGAYFWSLGDYVRSGQADEEARLQARGGSIEKSRKVGKLHCDVTTVSASSSLTANSFPLLFSPAISYSAMIDLALTYATKRGTRGPWRAENRVKLAALIFRFFFFFF